MKALLTSIEVENFKTFKGKVSIGGLGLPFSAIIGRNASGNDLVDAMAFCMGEKCTNLRVSKPSDLVFGKQALSHGSETTDSTYGNRTSVTAVFEYNVNNRKRFIRLTRAVSTNQMGICYSINENSVTSFVYRAKLEELGISVKHKNTMIFQDTVELTVSMTPKDLTELFEEISASDVFKQEYSQLLSVMQLKEQHVAEQRLDIVALREICDLAKDQVDSADIYTSTEKSITQKQTTLDLLRLFVIDKSEMRLEKESENVQRQLTEYNNAKKMVEAKIKEKKKEIDDLSKHLTVAEQDIFEKEKDVNEEILALVQTEANVSYLRSELPNLRLRTSKAEQVREKQQNVIDRLEGDILHRHQQREDLQEELDSITNLSEDDEVRYEELRMTAQMEHAALLNLDIMKEERIRKQLALDCAKCELSCRETLIWSYTTEKERASQKLETIKQNIVSTESELSEVILLRDGRQTKLDAAKALRHQLETEIEVISNKLDDSDHSQHLQQKMQDAAELKLLFPGVFGIVWDLCKPADVQRHQTAYLRVFGSNVNAVIVDTTETAVKCIEHLRVEGRSNVDFLSMNDLRVKPLKVQIRTIEDPQGVELLYDVLEFSPDIERAIRFITNNTAVCNTNEDAEILAFDLRQCNAVSMDDGWLYSKNGMLHAGDLVDLARQVVMCDDIRLIQHRDKLHAELKVVIPLATQDHEVMAENATISYLEIRLDSLKNNSQPTTDSLETKLTDLNAEKVQKLLKIAAIEAEMSAALVEVTVSASQERIFSEFCLSLGFGSIEEMEQKLHRKWVLLSRIAELDESTPSFEELLPHERVFLRNKIEVVEQTRQRCEALEVRLDAEIQLEPSVKAAVDTATRELAFLTAHLDKRKRDLQNRTNCLEEMSNILTNTSKHIRFLESKLFKIETEMRKIDMDRRDILLAAKLVKLNSGSDSESRSTRRKVAENEFSNNLPLSFWNLSETAAAQKCVTMKQDIKKMMAQLEKITPNLNASEYRRTIINNLNAAQMELQRLRNSWLDTTERFNTVKKNRSSCFADCFNSVKKNIDGIFKKLTGDTTAKACLVAMSPKEPYLDGLKYCYSSPKNGMDNFDCKGSAIAAVAMLFALRSFRPSPVLVVDNIDARLDKYEVKNLVRFIEERGQPVIAVTRKEEFYRHAQTLIVVSDDPFETAAAGTDVSEVITLDLSNYPLNDD